MIDRELVTSCYRAILGREPDNASVVEEKLAWASSAEALIREFLDSAEFQSRLPRRIADDYFRQKARIDVDVSELETQALFQRMQIQWRELGRQEPFWSVLTHDEYRTTDIDDAALARFYKTGAEHAGLLDLFCARNEVEIRRGVCLELGCGVGRVTKHLAKRFEKIIAADISEGNLVHCKAMAEREGISNIECVLIKTPDTLISMPYLDCFYSTIVLQHNPPPIQKIQLELIMNKMTPGGVFFFQTQTYAADYCFHVDEYLRSPIGIMDMHSLPMHEILHVIERHGHSLCEVAADMWTGRYGSHTFFGYSRPQRQQPRLLESASL